ncbi:hypothetical protein ANN_05844 [Periplaneta americana]|uniref:Reverse transcriptase domain-containing protein n=1 Tax=Periplaneta americana TaxID=6978 RepID=A0ABQ8TBY1_PERAM|nr:hypothetical protein ANN_05844 [Periplaneta americana]
MASAVEDDFKVGSTILNTILFADDQVVFADKEDNLQLALFQLNKTMSKYYLTVSHEKTKVMAFIGKYQIRSKIILNNMILEQVRHFNYLGCDISFDEERDLKQKVHRFQSICGTIKRTLKNKTRKDTVLKFYKTMAVPVLAYGAETWAMNRSDKRIIETAEMRFLRYVAGCTLRDHIRSEDIRAHLNIFCLNKRIEENQVQWKEHISRMPDERLVKQVLQYRPTGERKKVSDETAHQSLMLAGSEFQSLGRAIVKEDEYEEVRWDGIVSIVSWRERVFRLWWEESQLSEDRSELVNDTIKVMERSSEPILTGSIELILTQNGKTTFGLSVVPQHWQLLKHVALCITFPVVNPDYTAFRSKVSTADLTSTSRCRQLFPRKLMIMNTLSEDEFKTAHNISDTKSSYILIEPKLYRNKAQLTFVLLPQTRSRFVAGHVLELVDMLNVMFYLTTLATAEVISASPDVPEFCPAGVLLHASKSTDMSLYLNAIDLARDRTRNLGHRRPALYQLANQVDFVDMFSSSISISIVRQSNNMPLKTSGKIKLSRYHKVYWGRCTRINMEVYVTKKEGKTSLFFFFAIYL